MSKVPDCLPALYILLAVCVFSGQVTCGIKEKWKPKYNPPTAELSLGAVGDFLFEDDLQEQIYRNNGSFESVWQPIVPYLRRPDIMYANHEGTATLLASHVVSGTSGKDKCNLVQDDVLVPDAPLVYGPNFTGPFYGGGPHLQFNYHPLLHKSMANSGIDIVSTANNHCLDRGYRGVNLTLDGLDKYGIAHAGTRRTKAPNHEGFYSIVERKGWRTAWIACTDSTNFVRNCRKWDRELVMDCYSKAMVDAVTYLAGRQDVHAVIAVVHWGAAAPKGAAGKFARKQGYDIRMPRGIVYQREPDCLQRHFTRELAEAGAAVILGMHPHVSQGFEKYQTASGRNVLIINSLGNFVSKGGWEATLPPPWFLGRGYNSEESLLYRRTSPLVNFNLRFDQRRNWAEASCLSYLPLWRRLEVRPARPGEYCHPPNADDELSEDDISSDTLQGDTRANATCTIREIYVEFAQPGDTRNHTSASSFNSSFNSSAEHAFMQYAFGQVRRMSDGGGVHSGTPWLAPLPEPGREAELQCYPLSKLPVTDVDSNVYKSWTYTNPLDKKKSTIQHIGCMKCERSWPSDGPGCHWCQFKSDAYCSNPAADKVVVVEKVSWDDCLRLVSKDARCSPWAYAGGKRGTCACMRAGKQCNLKSAGLSTNVFVHFCGQTGGSKTGGIAGDLIRNTLKRTS